ncbi:MAG: aminotransferase class V-fold PLP-dependent enzyme [Flavobacteriales bacterium]|nr:aminotransferase class V-fold PLP-dependent enzyme [Flavobacteriales bacterium]
MNEKEISTILFQLGEEEKPYGAIAPPIVRTSNFSFHTIAEYKAAIQNEKDMSIYSRGNNPTVRLLEKKVAALQGTEDALFFGSGAAAISAAITSQLSSGDHVICVEHCYSWTQKLLTQTLNRFGVKTTFVDGRELKNFTNAFRSNTSLIILESPTSFSFHLQPLSEVVAWAKKKNIITLIDYSYGSPLSRKPVELGIDLICHTATKFIGGHSDTLGGVICAKADVVRKIFNDEYMTFGAVLSPDSAALFLRSLRTIQMRIAHSANTARVVFEFLNSHVAIEKVVWPFDEGHPQYHLVKEQFDSEIPLFSIQLKTLDDKKIIRFCESLSVFQLAVSWGGYESLIIPAIAFDSGPHQKNLVRLYIGFESADLLIEDLAQALEKISS